MSGSAELQSSIGWRLTGHARDAVKRRGFLLRDVLLAAVAPDLAYSQENHGPGRAIHRRGSLAVAVHVPTRTIITVLLNSPYEWDDETCMARAAGGLLRPS
jgi:hypothetical protein